MVQEPFLLPEHRPAAQPQHAQARLQLEILVAEHAFDREQVQLRVFQAAPEQVVILIPRLILAGIVIGGEDRKVVGRVERGRHLGTELAQIRHAFRGHSSILVPAREVVVDPRVQQRLVAVPLPAPRRPDRQVSFRVEAERLDGRVVVLGPPVTDAAVP